LRARQPELFATGAYHPLPAPEATCAFLRGDDILVVVGLREGAGDGQLEAPGGTWRNVLQGEERTLSGRVAVGDLIGSPGVAVLERLRGT
jgi:maltooligosyltrehalose synthase